MGKCRVEKGLASRAAGPRVLPGQSPDFSRGNSPAPQCLQQLPAGTSITVKGRAKAEPSGSCRPGPERVTFSVILRCMSSHQAPHQRVEEGHW